jgi:hypothetical protein
MISVVAVIVTMAGPLILGGTTHDCQTAHIEATSMLMDVRTLTGPTAYLQTMECHPTDELTLTMAWSSASGLAPAFDALGERPVPLWNHPIVEDPPNTASVADAR